MCLESRNSDLNVSAIDVSGRDGEGNEKVVCTGV